MGESGLVHHDAAAHADVSSGIRERYVAFRKAQAELRAWVEFGGEEESATEEKLRAREATALDALVKAPAASIADLAVKLQVLKDLATDSSDTSSAALKVLAEDVSRLSTPIGKLERQITALRIGLMLLLNAAAGDAKSLERARHAILDLLESPTGSRLADSKLDETAKKEVGSLFTWID